MRAPESSAACKNSVSQMDRIPSMTPRRPCRCTAVHGGANYSSTSSSHEYWVCLAVRSSPRVDHNSSKTAPWTRRRACLLLMRARSVAPRPPAGPPRAATRDPESRASCASVRQLYVLKSGRDLYCTISATCMVPKNATPHQDVSSTVPDKVPNNAIYTPRAGRGVATRRPWTGARSRAPYSRTSGWGCCGVPRSPQARG